MIKKHFLCLLLLVLSYTLFSQENRQPADIVVGKYIISLVENKDKTYGYEIFEAQKRIIKYTEKSYSKDKKGYREKQNAITAALYYVNEILIPGRRNVTIDKKKAKDIGITNIDLQP